MCKQLFFIVLFSSIISGVYAQKGNNALSVNGEVAVPFLQDNNGFGFSLKGAYGIGKSAQLTLSAGFSTFKPRTSGKSEDATTRIIPILFGYKQNIQHFFIEPKVGIGELGGKVSVGGDYAKPSVAAFFGGITAGYSLKQVSFGVNFLTANGIENSSAGLWYNKSFHYTSIFVSYDLFTKSKR
ncbi:MAG: hypothetical protein J0I41_22675 [Filimonas sp.]|nr:hypothetical protein [Filimonas sp.]